MRWYQPVAVGVFVALAAPGALLLDSPWDGLWVLVVLVANPVARRLRAQGHVLTHPRSRVPHPRPLPWPSVANVALAATAGIAIAVLLWAEAHETDLATNATGVALLALLTGGALSVDRHQRRHIAGLLDDDNG